jgi:hypothetical protein
MGSGTFIEGQEKERMNVPAVLKLEITGNDWQDEQEKEGRVCLSNIISHS